MNYASDAEGADAVVSEIRAAGGQTIAVHADVAKPEQVHDMFDMVDKELGVVTGLINNAGVTGSTGRVEDLDDKKLADCLN